MCTALRVLRADCSDDVRPSGATAPDLAARFDLANVPTWTPRYHVAPTQEVLVVVQPSAQANREARLHRWGLIPHG